MSTPNDGGSVHPVHPDYFKYAPRYPDVMQPEEHAAFLHGMSLRDHFAGQFLAGSNFALAKVAEVALAGGDQGSTAKIVAEYAYLIADAMLAARSKEGA